MEKLSGKKRAAAPAALALLLLAAGALGLGLAGCEDWEDMWHILSTGELYWEKNSGGGGGNEGGEGEEERGVYAFRYEANGGELDGGTPESDIVEGETVTLPPSGSRVEYTLTGFTLSGAAEGAFTPGGEFTMPAGDVTAVANWTETAITIANGKFILARVDLPVGPYVIQWKEKDDNEAVFHYLFDEEGVLNFAQWDQEAQRLYKDRVIELLDSSLTRGMFYSAVRKFKDTGRTYVE
jgi:hypothetical protein